MRVRCDSCQTKTDNVKIVTTEEGERLLCAKCAGGNYDEE